MCVKCKCVRSSPSPSMTLQLVCPPCILIYHHSLHCHPICLTSFFTSTCLCEFNSQDCQLPPLPPAVFPKLALTCFLSLLPTFFVHCSTVFKSLFFTTYYFSPCLFASVLPRFLLRFCFSLTFGCLQQQMTDGLALSNGETLRSEDLLASQRQPANTTLKE